MTPLYVSLAVNILFFAFFVVAVWLLNRAGRAIRQYEEFFDNSVEELEPHVKHIQRLINNNVIFQNDDDVKQVFKAIKASYQTIIGYANAGIGVPTRQD